MADPKADVSVHVRQTLLVTSQERKLYKPTSTKPWIFAPYIVVLLVGLVLIGLVTQTMPEVADVTLHKTLPSSTPTSAMVTSTSMNAHFTARTKRAVITATVASSVSHTFSSPITLDDKPIPSPIPNDELTIQKPPADQTTSTNNPSEPSVTPGDPPGNKQLHFGGDLNGSDYFLVLYFPKILAVILQFGWAITFAATHLMDPFYRLVAKRKGPSAEKSLLAPFLGPGILKIPMSSLYDIDDWIILLTTTVFISLGFIISIVNEAITVVPTRYCYNESKDQYPCDPTIAQNAWATRVLQALISIVIAALLILAVLNSQKKSPVYSDPSTIMSAADMLGDTAFLGQLKRIDPLATERSVKKALKGKRYRLANIGGTVDNPQLSIVEVNQTDTTGEFYDKSESETGYQRIPAASSETDLPKRPQRSMFRWNRIVENLGLLAISLGLFAIILAYRLIHDQANPLNKFMNGEGFGPQFILSGTPWLISLGWKRIERHTRLREIYRSMSIKPQPAMNSINLSMAGDASSYMMTAFLQGHYFASHVAFITLLSQALMITVTGIPLSDAQTAVVYRFSTYMSLSVLGLMSLTIIWIVIRQRRDLQLPRDPDTLAAVFLYLLGGNLVAANTDRQAGMELENEKRDGEMKYTFGFTAGTDGIQRWSVNEHGR